ncbi:MAG: preprotein translocase subunit SecG [Legionellales bacterium]|nr:preprotein translocase subunit SecG [Legionellales bacterium]|tara:strand:+ start:6069 stop:6452 length:384 start_codon:yes stop_codon:yes gene_type:complete
MEQLLLVLHVLTCVSLVAMILLQQGKGADIGAAFGSGASNTVFGSPGSSSFLFKFTATLAAVFFATSIGIGYLAATDAKHHHGDEVSSIIDQVESQTQPKTDNVVPATQKTQKNSADTTSQSSTTSE